MVCGTVGVYVVELVFIGYFSEKQVWPALP